MMSHKVFLYHVQSKESWEKWKLDAEFWNCQGERNFQRQWERIATLQMGKSVTPNDLACVTFRLGTEARVFSIAFVRNPGPSAWGP